MPRTALRPAADRVTAVRLAALLALAAGVAASGCRGREGPLPVVVRELAPGERVLALRDLDSVAARSVAAIIVAPGGKPELRIFQVDERGEYRVTHRSSQGDAFRNLDLEDVDADGRDEILVTWRGGHLEMIEVIARAEDGSCRTLFQNAGREIERRVGRDGRIEFWIGSRTYEENPGQPPAYDTAIYRFKDGAYVEVPG